MAGIYAPIKSMVSSPMGTASVQSLPRAGLLFYSLHPNATGADVGKYILQDATTGNTTAVAIRAATGWVSGTANLFYDAAGASVVVSSAQILAWSGINQYHILFSATKGLAIYDPYTVTDATIVKADRYMKQPLYDDTPTVFYNGVDTTGKTSYTGGPTYVPDNLGVLRTPGANVPALQGLRLEWVPSGVELSGGSIAGWVDSASSTHTATTLTVISPGGVILPVQMTVGSSYRISVQGSGDAGFTVNTTDALFPTTRTELFAGFGTVTVTAVSGSRYPYLRLNAASTATITSISVKELIPTYYDTSLDGTPIVTSTSQPTRTFDAGFTAATQDAHIQKRYNPANPLVMPGQLFEPARTNYALQSATPATHTTGTVPVGTYTLSIEGSGSIAATEGTAIGTFATATEAAPATITITTAGTVVLTKTGTVTWVQLELGAFKTSRIYTTTASATRAGTVLTYPTAGKIRSNNMAFRMIVVPRAIDSSYQNMFGLYVDSLNRFQLYFNGTSVVFEKRVAGVSASTQVASIAEVDKPLQIVFLHYSSYGIQVATRKYSSGSWGSWVTSSVNATSPAKLNQPIPVNFQFGANGNSIQQLTGNIPLFDTLFIPDGITDPLAWAKAQWGIA